MIPRSFAAIGRLPSRAARLLRERDAATVLRALARRVCTRDDFVILRRDLHDTVPAAECPLSFALRRVPDTTLQDFRTRPYPFWRHHQYRFHHGQRRCYAAFVGARIGALMWPAFASDNHRVVSPWRQLWPDEARIGSIWTDPEYRGTGLMAACLQIFADHLAGRGFRYLYACTWVGNAASIRLHERLGFRPVGMATRYALGWQREGRGLYRRSRIAREPLAHPHPGGDCELPDALWDESPVTQTRGSSAPEPGSRGGA